MLVKDDTVEGLPRSPPPPPPPSSSTTTSSSSSSSKCNYGNANTQSCAPPPWCWTNQKCGANPVQAAPPPPPSCASRSKCGIKKLIVSVVGTLIFLKFCKLAACALGFFLGWVVIPAGGAVLGLGFAVATRLISTVFYSLLLGFAVWRFTWLVSLCYVAGNGLRTHWSKRHDYFNSAKLWFWMKKDQFRASAIAQMAKPHREKLRKLKQRLHQFKHQQHQQHQQRRAHGSANTDTITAEKPSHEGAANIPGAVPQQQAPQQQQQQQRLPRPSAPAQAMPAPGASTDFLEFAAAMSDALTQYERANGLPIGTTNTFISDQRQQQQQHAEGRLYPRLDSDDGTVAV